MSKGPQTLKAGRFDYAHRSCRGRHLHRQESLYFDKLSNRNSIGSLSYVEGAAYLLKDGRFDCAHRSCRGRHLHRQGSLYFDKFSNRNSIGSLSCVEGAADSKSWTVRLRSPVLSWQTSAPPRIPELCRRGRIPSENWTVRLRSPILSCPANCAHRSCHGRHLHRQGSLSEIEGAVYLLKDGRFDCARRSCITFQKELLSDPLRFQ